MCKKKILTLLLTLTLVASTTVNYKNVFAVDAINNEEISILNNNYSSVDEINKSENIDSEFCVKGTIVNILDNCIIIEDSGMQASILAENLDISNLTIGNLIFARGIVTKKTDSEETVLLVKSSENLGLLVQNDTESNDGSNTDNTDEGTNNTDTDNKDDVNSDKDNNTSDNNSNINGNNNNNENNNNNDNLNNGNSNNNNNNLNQNGNGNANSNGNNQGNHNQNNNSSQGGNSNNLNNSNGGNNSINFNTNNNSNTLSNNSNTSTISKIKAKTVVTISEDLSESQWSKVKSALEDGLVKLIDLPNNKIKIVQVLEDSGDKIWIVNDPEQKDIETEEDEESVFTVGYELMKSLDVSNFDITETKWNSILSKIEKGTAKAKLNDEGNLQIRYVVDDGKDTISTISKIK